MIHSFSLPSLVSSNVGFRTGLLQFVGNFWIIPISITGFYSFGRNVQVRSHVNYQKLANLIFFLSISNCYLLGMFEYAAYIIMIITLPLSNLKYYSSLDRSVLFIENVFPRNRCCNVVTVVTFKILDLYQLVCTYYFLLKAYIYLCRLCCQLYNLRHVYKKCTIVSMMFGFNCFIV